MATNIPPHNISEVCDAMIHLIDNPESNIKELMNFIKGPDFPTAASISGKGGIISSYLSGRGKVIMKAIHHIEEKGDRKSIIITEIPYQLNKVQLIEEIAELVKSDRIEEISDIRDESNKEGIRIVFVLKKNANQDVVLNQLYKFSRLKSTFGCNMVVLVNGEPKTLNLKQILVEFIKHRKEVVTRRTQFELREAKDKEHKLEGLRIALDNIDKVVELIKSSKSTQEATESLSSHFGLSEIQSKTVLDMRLQRLTSLEQDKIRDDLSQTKMLITELETILSDERNIFGVIKKETKEVKEKYGDIRKTQIIEGEEEEINTEDLIEEENMVVTMTNDGYVKRVPLTIYREQNRGGKGVLAASTKEEDVVKDVFIASTHETILCFTKKGMVHWLKVHNIPEGSRQAKGKAIINLLSLEGDSPSTLLPLGRFEPENSDGDISSSEGEESEDSNTNSSKEKNQKYILFVTEKGYVKKTNLIAYSRPRKGGIIAITLEEGDNLVDVLITGKDKDILLATRNGGAIRFSEQSVRSTGRSARGVRGIRLRQDDKVVGAVYLEKEKDILTVTEKGHGKRTPSDDYRSIGRAGKGVINIKTTPKNGKVVSVLGVSDGEGVMIISKKGIIIRIGTNTISRIGRNTQGVRVMNLIEGDEVVATAKIITGDESIIKKEGGDQMKPSKEKTNTNDRQEYTEEEYGDTEKELEEEVEDDEINSEEEGFVRGYVEDEFKTIKSGTKEEGKKPVKEEVAKEDDGWEEDEDSEDDDEEDEDEE